MSDGKLKQNHVFVKNNVGSLALHKAKQEIGGIKMDKWKELLNEHKTSDCRDCLIEANKLGALEELNDEKCFLKTTKRFNAKRWNNALEERLKFIILRINELEE